ncbi:glycosyltransferase [Methanoculleus chikugoensis]|uniref:glycosyltransferase n=1 Tax=Methanoculleus chikugoensis TaxID=118126 RepID=UPI000A655F9D|nr:glycosyltransferase [Methanoculleus chikugoensis]
MHPGDVEGGGDIPPRHLPDARRERPGGYRGGDCGGGGGPAAGDHADRLPPPPTGRCTTPCAWGSIGLLVFQPDYYNAYIGLPNKLFDYMLCGLPVVASDFPEIRKVVAETECGVLVDPTDPPDAIAEAITYLLEHPDAARRMGGENGRKAVLERYNWGGRWRRGCLGGVYRAIEGQLGGVAGGSETGTEGGESRPAPRTSVSSPNPHPGGIRLRGE